MIAAKTHANALSKSPLSKQNYFGNPYGVAPSFNRFNGKNTYKQFEVVNQDDKAPIHNEIQLEQLKDHPEYLKNVTDLTVKSAQVKNCSIATYMAKNIDKIMQ